MRKILLVILLFISIVAGAIPRVLSDSAQIYLLTCTPGTQVWSKYGHTGIRVVDKTQKLDIVFNYGIFDLTSDDFYIKFVHGETYYQLGIESYYYFDKFYSRIGRVTYWQELNLSTAYLQRIYSALLVNYQPENRRYLYNFVFDNCATRPYHLIKNALEDTIISSYKGYEGTTFRTAITHYTGTHSWVDFGINLVFGRDADVPMTNEQRLFLPEELMNYIAHATLSDGTALVKNQHIGTFPPARVPWYANCWWGIGLFALLLLMISLYDRRRGRLTWGIDVALCVVYLLLIALVIFLTCFSCHPLVGFNWRLILFPLIHVCTRLIYIFR
jgi:hypothetical protein